MEVTPVAAAPVVAAAPRPEALRLADPERELLGRLGPLMSTPRAAKRLVNIYRMLRVSVPPDKVADDADIWAVLGSVGDLGDRLAAIRQHVALHRAEPYRRWAGPVSRFSFRLAVSRPPVAAER